MKIEEFVRLDPKQIRHDKELMQLFVDFYKAAFSFEPSCAGCSFKTGFIRLKRYANGDKKNINFKEKMEAKTFVLKNTFKTKILTYKKDGKVYRKYGHALTEEFARELVKAGKGEVFSTLPSDKPFNIEAVDVNYEYVDKWSNMNYRDEIVPLYLKVKESTGKKAESMRKADIIKFLKENEG